MRRRSARLTQIQHGDAPCSRYVVRSMPNSVTVSYSCRAGQGLTTIRKESPELIQIQSQGIRNNAPFSFSVEAARRLASGCAFARNSVNQIFTISC